MAAPQGVSNTAPESDNSGVGNGTIGTGGVPMPREMEFTGTDN